MNIKLKILSWLGKECKTPEYLKAHVEKFKNYSLSYIRKSLKQLVKEDFICEASGNNNGYTYSLGFYIPIVNPFLLEKHNLKVNDTFLFLEDIRRYKKAVWRVKSINSLGIYSIEDLSGNKSRMGKNVKVIFYYSDELFKP